MADSHEGDRPRDAGRVAPILRDCHDESAFILDEDECQVFGPDEDPLGDFGLDDEETFPDERDFWIEPED